MSTFISGTIKKPTTKQKNTINIKCIIANIAQANVLYSGTTYTNFLADPYLNSYNKNKNQNNCMDIKNKNEFKYHILTTYLVNQKHTEPVPCYNLETIVDYGYALYKRRGRYMYLVDIIPLIKTKNKTPSVIKNRHTTNI
ncbi:hypothetical protein XNC3_2790008 [Xenorhabdus nematophila F1]|uniref:Uncharacterized protein n=1 Tax=Xenorhabdus nematophila (strain ATCC 19061 / DSM 3370 / CCUG 14189 / LMG 1036 / NCIMB 9965 / AN6) TaxID=406817 RepID=D3V9A7_XENNA|nr:hypothetical protein XNC1_3410 [Xenorhabdus nematophila ATCC 19061]CCW31802.1 hypothetical protein XNC3_2790008 [Xenorhabdus nematophila F1]CEE93236.1 hypothetical protein XNA1_3530006 [Xenorhabdus nematophila str. Anatoliense]CEK24278.1 hypothetical protein XNC2_3284 [Xenorhabdus nematophila AN6/1]